MDEERVTYSVGGSPSHAPIPPLARRQIRAVDFELAPCRIPLCNRLQAFDVAPVAELALCIAAHDFVAQDARHPEILLHRGGLLAYSRHCTRTAR